MLCLHFADVREEEYGASRAGASPRFDFLIKDTSVIVETKMTRQGLTSKKLGDELAADVLRYQQPHVKAMFALIYDPERRITNPTGFENDLREDDPFTVRVAITH
jgi:hypothetical protein